MESAEIILNDNETRERDAFVERILASTSGTFDIFTIYLGDRLGYYQTLADKGALTSAELATYTETLKRFAEKAGFCNVEVLPIDNFFFRFYRLNPVCALAD